MSSAAAPTASGSAIHVSARVDSRVSSKPSTSASAGNIGRMYDGSFEPDTLKNTKMNAAQTTQKRAHEKPLAASGAARQLLRQRPARRAATA